MSPRLRVACCKLNLGRRWLLQSGSMEPELGMVVFMDIQNPDSNEAVSAELAAGGAGVEGHLTLTGYTTGPSE